MLQGLMLVALVILVCMNAFAWVRATRFQGEVNAKLAKLDTTIGQLSAKVQAPAAQAKPARRGPDPNKVHTVNTSGSPSKGLQNAPITIAEFSDFQ